MTTQEQVDKAVNAMFGPSAPDLQDSINYDMLLIQALDRGASLEFTTTSTGSPDGTAWYVAAQISVTDDGKIGDVTEHRATPWDALQAYRLRLQAVETPDAIVTRHYGEERRYIWNGAAWREVSP